MMEPWYRLTFDNAVSLVRLIEEVRPGWYPSSLVLHEDGYRLRMVRRDIENVWVEFAELPPARDVVLALDRAVNA